MKNIQERIHYLIDSFKRGDHISYYKPENEDPFIFNQTEPIIIRRAKMLAYVF